MLSSVRPIILLLLLDRTAGNILPRMSLLQPVCVIQEPLQIPDPSLVVRLPGRAAESGTPVEYLINYCNELL